MPSPSNLTRLFQGDHAVVRDTGEVVTVSAQSGETVLVHRQRFGNWTYRRGELRQPVGPVCTI